MRLIDVDILRKEITTTIRESCMSHQWKQGMTYALGLVEAQPTITPESQWIPVTEKLPDESGLYQVTDIQGEVVRYVFVVNEGFEEYWRRCVKAWMPLPEPYKEVTE